MATTGRFAAPTRSPPPPPRLTDAHPSPLPHASAFANRASRDDPLPPVTTRVEGLRAATGTVRRASAVRSASVGVRAAAAVLCLIAFSVMAADRSKGWALDSYNLYAEYRYVVAVNVIGFVYSGFQVCAEVHFITSGKHILSRPMGYYFDFTIDQILTYLLISASSSATTRTNYWVANYGKDPFPDMATGSIAMSFLAFIAFAISSLISTYNLFTRCI